MYPRWLPPPALSKNVGAVDRSPEMLLTVAAYRRYTPPAHFVQRPRTFRNGSQSSASGLACSLETNRGIVQQRAFAYA
jgi:hypothetical protein